MNVSRQQAEILCFVLRVMRERQARIDNPHVLDYDAQWGVAWRPFAHSPSPSERASMSRALRRLEQRGLIRRRNHITGDRWQAEPYSGREPGRHTRTSDVLLTDEGRRIAERLTNDAARSC